MQANNAASADKQGRMLLQLERALMSRDCARALMALKAGARLDSSRPLWSSSVGEAAMCEAGSWSGRAQDDSEMKELIDALLAGELP